MGKIVIAGSGFAGMWAAISAARAAHLADRSDEVSITIVSPRPNLVIRPRLYEADLTDLNPDLQPLFDVVGVQHLPGIIRQIDHASRQVEVERTDGRIEVLDYDRFVLATGSRLFRPNIPGLADHAFDVDQLESAERLQQHLQSLASRPDSAARNTAIVIGGGFTGIEAAAELPSRLRKVLGESAKVEVVIVEQAATVGPDLGPNPRPVIEDALSELGVQIVAGHTVTAISADGVTLDDGRRLPASTVVWTAGVRAHPLAKQVPGEADAQGRLKADSFLRAPDAPGIFVTGDMVNAATDNFGNTAMMSCQHAQSLGRVAGHNAASELLGLPLHSYSQPKYVTCLDLGPWGAIYAEGWERKVRLMRDVGKTRKTEINTHWIYPPAADRDAAFAIANPDFIIVPDEDLDSMAALPGNFARSAA